MSATNATNVLRTVRLGFFYMVLNLKTIYRQPAALFFVVAFPIMFLVIFSSLLTFEIGIPEEAGANVPVVKFSQYFVAGIMGVAIFGTSFNLLGTSLAIQQFDGTLKQLAATPLPKASFFIGLVGTALTYTVLQLVIMLILGVAAYGIELPDAHGWLTLIWIVLLGVPAGCVLGIAITKIIPSANAAPAGHPGSVSSSCSSFPASSSRSLQCRPGCNGSPASSPCAGSPRACDRSSCPMSTSSPSRE